MLPLPGLSPQDHVTFKMAALELDHLAVPLELFPAIISQSTAKKSLRQNHISRSLLACGRRLQAKLSGLITDDVIVSSKSSGRRGEKGVRRARRRSTE